MLQPASPDPATDPVASSPEQGWTRPQTLSPTPPAAAAVAAQAAPARLAIFDLDGTLTEGDTTLAWLRALGGWPRMALACLGGLAVWLLPLAEHRRTRFKRGCLFVGLAGIPLDRAEEAARALTGRIGWQEAMVARLAAHLAAGDRVAIATGAAEPLAVGLVSGLIDRMVAAAPGGTRPVLSVLATPLESRNGRLTGRLGGGNCVRSEKARRVRLWIQAQPAGLPVSGYGNLPHDGPFLDLCDERVVI